MANYNMHADYDAVACSPLNVEERPVIGICSNFGEKGSELSEGYYQSVCEAGGVPLIIPPMANASVLLPLIERIDGLIISGGADLNPLWTGEDPIRQLGNLNPERDRAELLLVQLAYDRQLPILGICRGEQLLTSVLGGNVVQDIYTSFPDADILKHSQQAPRWELTHFVDTEAGSIVEKLLGERFAVNSFHHQAVGEPGPRLRVTARSADGIVEAVESTEHRPIIGVQWHPECYILKDNRDMLPLFGYIVGQADLLRRARRFHDQTSIVTLDSHCDTPMFFDRGVQFDQRDSKVLVDYHKMCEGHLDAVIMAAYLEQLDRSDEGLAAATEKARRIIDEIHQMVRHTEGAALARTPADLLRNKRDGLKSIMVGIENGYAIGRDIENVERFSQMGVVYMTLCHNGDNDICDSARKSNAEHGGLSPFGRDVVREMNRLGMMVDLSHAAESSFFDAIELSEVPCVCSHSSSRALCNHPRNLTDDQLRALAESGGVAQVTLYSGFLSETGDATIDDAVAHLLHMIDVAGIDHVGFGSDFDGDGGIPGCRAANEVLNFTMKLIDRGLTHEDLEKIWGKNFLRVMQQTQDNATTEI